MLLQAFPSSSSEISPAGDIAWTGTSPETSDGTEQFDAVTHREEGERRQPPATAGIYIRRKLPGRKMAEDPPAIKSTSVMKRYHTSDGRLILREETATHREYLRAHRSNGRLRLELVSLNVVVRRQGEGEDDDGGIIQCGKVHGNTCSYIESQPSITRLRSRLLQVPVTETH
ncbi:PREDICTED: uncharacterized protein LOC104816921 isoform X2 [Tarenaya hassleriana]|uniref:uncharacterized protein LOC104816921 isoform X3 n=1 Tax=Tarenaya hassleriana TaxID=28532 RepID=UPI00053C6A2C|nr:PREDICTED: uncharacterized protein LOC104816921 isoform X3 [Tarenaya hassleriana]XP_010544275.1 PREDICTED: uncharacterized protein LOC104816921 isoform X2 [Tarenaya hassleriana]